MADDQELRENSFDNKSKIIVKEDDFVESNGAESENENANSRDLRKEPNEKNSESFNSENDASFKVPTAVQNDSKTSESVSSEKKENAPELRYKVPCWSAIPPEKENFSLEVLKNGCIISTLNLNKKAYHVFGRLPMCDIVLEHPSISRYHALLQYRGESDGDGTLSGFYLFDLGSTHGTAVNKSKIKAKTYYRLKVGYVIKFGGSSRLFILQGPRDDEDDKNERSPTEMMAAATTENETKVKVGQIFTDEEYESLKKVEDKSEESEGIDWGFGEDAEEEQIDSEKFQELYSGVEFKDPKKTLRGYYEREGLELEYQVDESGPGHARVYHCKVRLPVDGPNGSAVYAEASVTGRKKDAVHECANEACKMLDAYGLLRQSSHESRKKRERNLEKDDFYESDEDNFLDRTGTIEKKRLKRMRKAGKQKTEVDTYETLLNKLRKIEEETTSLVKQIQQAEALEETENGDSLDDFMNTMSQRMDKQTKIKLKRKIVELRKEGEKIKKLVALTKPAELPSLQSEPTNSDSSLTLEKTSKTGSQENVSTSVESDNLTSTTISNPVEQPNATSQSFTAEFTMPTSTVRPVKAKKFPRPTETGNEVRTWVEDKSVKHPKQTESEKAECESKNTSTQSIMDTKEKDFPRDKSQTIKKEKRYTAPTQWEDANDPDFDNWVPPEGQTGDGKTKLNAKYGY